MKKIYMYSKRYPEYGIQEIEVYDKEYRVNKDYKILMGIYAKFNIGILVATPDLYYISLNRPYEDDDILVHEENHREYIFSYDKEKITNMLNEQIKREIERTERRLKELKEVKL